MANKIGYTGRIIVRAGETIPFERTSTGLYILGPFVVAEDHQQKVSRVRKQPKLAHILEEEHNFGKADDDYITVATSWHRVKVIGDKAAVLAQDAKFNKGALIDVEASYEEDTTPWVDREGITRTSRPESIGDKMGSVNIRFGPFEEAAPLWDGISDVPEPQRRGGGQAREYRDDEGF